MLVLVLGKNIDFEHMLGLVLDNSIQNELTKLQRAYLFCMSSKALENTP